MQNSEPERYLPLAAPKFTAVFNLKAEVRQCRPHCGPSTAPFASNLIHRLTQNDILLMQVVLVEMAKKCESISGYLDGIGGGDWRTHCRIRGANFFNITRS